MQLGLTEQVAFLSSGWGSSCRPAGKDWNKGLCACMLRGLLLKLLNLYFLRSAARLLPCVGACNVVSRDIE